MWLWFTLISGVLLGFYDISKKKALETVPLLNVLALYSIFSFLFVSSEFTNAMYVHPLSIALVFLKSVVIFFSWLFGFIAIRGLPISIITPFGTINALFSILLGILILNERLSPYQFVGIAIIFSSYYFLGKVSTEEVKGLFKNRFFYFMVAAMFLSAVSALIDKIALKDMNVGQMQFWFSFFVAVLYVAAFLFSHIKNRNMRFNTFSWYIPVMSLFLIVSDRIYFTAVKIPTSQIAIIMPLRKVSIFVSAIIGGLLFREKNLKRKLVCISLLLVGLVILFTFK